MRILVINSGSSSIKYTLFEFPCGKVQVKGIVERVSNHEEAIRVVLDKGSGVDAIGHRVVHGGEEIKESVVITEDVIRVIEKYCELAPLHNPPNLLGIRACQRLLPGVRQVAVFDTAYYQSMPASSYLYGLPYELYKKYGIRKYGFHGTSHRYVAMKTAEILKRPIEKLKIITCHLGNGCSVTATQFGKAIDTSLGFTPLEGLIMGTRCGDIDPAVVFYIMDKEKIDVHEINELLNKKSGLLGLSGISHDMRDIVKAAKEGREQAVLTIDVFIHRIQKYIGAYIVGMNGVDAITFTGGIGENHPQIHTRICKNLEFLKKVKILVVPTNEELLIAQDTMRLVGSS